MSHPSVLAPTVEQHASSFGIGVASPRISWRFLLPDTPPKNWQQTAYELEIARTPASEASETVEQFKINGSASVLVPWPSSPLRSREQARVRVRVYGTSSGAESSATASEWSPWTTVEAGLLQPEDWTARPIASATRICAVTDESPDDKDLPLRPIIFRRTFSVAESVSVSRARLYITSFGVYKAHLNGQPVGDHEMAPGWTSYAHRINYQVFDVTEQLRPGKEANELLVEVAEGWYAGRLGFHGGRRCIYGDELAVLAQLELGEPGARSVQRIATDALDGLWTCQPSPVVRSEIYDGEEYDARQEELGESTWLPVKELPFPRGSVLAAPDAPPVRVTEKRKPAAFITTPSGKTIVDFGQNLVGRLRVRELPQRPAGHRFTFRHAEVLEDGELGVRPLRIAKCTDTVISAGQALADWAPRFTFHGFRYVQVEGWTPTEADADLLAAEVMHTDMQRTGRFQCSHQMINKLHENAVWSMRGNFLSIPTDCPQRDERLGWTGDIQVFTPSANFLYNTAGFLSDWLRDVQDEQLEPDNNGVPPFVVPNVIQKQWPRMPQAVWDDVTVLTPWVLYRSYGDVAILRRQYSGMVAWLDSGVQRGPNGLWDEDLWQLGDWLDPAAPPDSPGDARTNGTIVADAYLVHVTSILAQISAILGEKADAARYAADARRLRATFQSKYVSPQGLMVADTQTALSLAIVFDLLETPEQVDTAGKRLVWHVRQRSFRVATGFAGTPIVTHALTKTGHHQVAYRMLQERERPSWMYPITMGATTIWERWDSMLPDGSINPGEMTSFNHYALGSVVNWLHETVAGIRAVDPGWKNFVVSPMPGGTVTSCMTSYETPYGRVGVRWTVQDGHFDLHVLVPANTRAVIVLPHERAAGQAGTSVGSGKHHFQSTWDSTANWPPTRLTHPMAGGSDDTFV